MPRVKKWIGETIIRIKTGKKIKLDFQNKLKEVSKELNLKTEMTMQSFLENCIREFTYLDDVSIDNIKFKEFKKLK